MSNLKSITDLPLATSPEGLNLIVNDGGAAKQIAASAVGAQADWAETNENSPSFIKNKPVEEWDLDLTITITWNTETSAANDPVINAAEGYSYDAFTAKINTGEIPNVRIRTSVATTATNTITELVKPTVFTSATEIVLIGWLSIADSNLIEVALLPDGTFDIAT